jgi:hypothetical protein
MCFRPVGVKKKEVKCPKCQEMNPMPLSIESPLSAISANEGGKAILEKHCSAMTADPRFKGAMGMTLKQVRPMSQGKITQEIYDTVAKELEQLPKAGCKKCGEALPAA